VSTAGTMRHMRGAGACVWQQTALPERLQAVPLAAKHLHTRRRSHAGPATCSATQPPPGERRCCCRHRPPVLPPWAAANACRPINKRILRVITLPSCPPVCLQIRSAVRQAGAAPCRAALPSPLHQLAAAAAVGQAMPQKRRGQSCRPLWPSANSMLCIRATARWRRRRRSWGAHPGWSPLQEWQRCLAGRSGCL
jgi:hypothetical protein